MPKPPHTSNYWEDAVKFICGVTELKAPDRLKDRLKAENRIRSQGRGAGGRNAGENEDASNPNDPDLIDDRTLRTSKYEHPSLLHN